MKWLKKGNERIEDTFQSLEGYQIYIFGAGDIGRALAITLLRFHLFAGFIDNDPQKQRNGFFGQTVYSYDEYKSRKAEDLVVVAASIQNELEICEQLKQEGILYVCAGEFLQKILPSYLFLEKNILMMSLAQICVTERCSLRCEKCAHACFAVGGDAEDLSITEVKDSADVFFEKVDYIQEFVLIGGEPLLYSDLAEAVRYIGEKYRKKMGIFSITTNGTIVPNEKLLKECRKCDVFFRISNYSVSVPKLAEKYERLAELFDREEISYYLGKAEEQWWDYGFTDRLEPCDEEGLIRRFDECATPCRETRNGRLYFCVMARAVSDNLRLGIGQEDYLDLRSLPEGSEGRRVLLEYNLGYSDKGYLSMCAKCRGKECVNFPVTAAKQMEKKKSGITGLGNG